APAPRPDIGSRSPRSRPAGRSHREDGMAGIVVKARFPRRRMVRTVVANLFRYLFGGAVRNWIRNIGGTAPALGSMTLLLLLTGLVGLCGFAIHNLDQLEAGQAAVLHVYISDAATSAEVDSLWDRLAKD